MWGEIPEAACDEDIRSNIRVLDRILEDSQLDCFTLVHYFEFSERFCAAMDEFKQIGGETNVLRSLLLYVLEVKDIGILTERIQDFLRHVAVDYGKLENANYHTTNGLVTEVAVMFKIFTEMNYYWDFENHCRRPCKPNPGIA